MFNVAYTPLISLVLGLSLAASALQGLPSTALSHGPMMADAAQGMSQSLEANMI